MSWENNEIMWKSKEMNKEEKQLADAYDSGELNLHPPSDELLKLLREAGENTFKKDKRINIRLSSHDLLGIQRKAARKGVPYQALIAGLIHQYVEGDFQEATRWAEITKSLGHTNLDHTPQKSRDSAPSNGRIIVSHDPFLSRKAA